MRSRSMPPKDPTIEEAKAFRGRQRTHKRPRHLAQSERTGSSAFADDDNGKDRTRCASPARSRLSVVMLREGGAPSTHRRCESRWRRWLLGHPPEPVLGLAEGETRGRMIHRKGMGNDAGGEETGGASYAIALPASGGGS